VAVSHAGATDLSLDRIDLGQTLDRVARHRGFGLLVDVDKLAACVSDTECQRDRSG
jgi:hypothetical protein